MGFISRKIFPACGNMCVCCPALRSRSRQPVKRYKKLLADAFPKSADSPPNDRKIAKLCEYAAKNPGRIPKITMYLEERCYKELRSQHVKLVEIIAETYNKLLSTCRDQMAYFAVGLLNVVVKLLEESEKDAFRIIGLQMLTQFIYSQKDGTYTYNLESLVRKVCTLALEKGQEHEKLCLRSSSLQCLSAMVWFMEEFSHIFDDFDQIIHATIENYEPSRRHGNGGEREVCHHWVDEVVRCEGRGIGDFSPGRINIRPRPERKDPSQLTRDELENPNVWAQICIQRIVDLAKESTTMRRVLDPMFVYFDKGRHWVPPHGLAPVVLSDMCYFMENSGNQLVVLAAVVRHLDRKNIIHDPEIKSFVIKTATYLARQIRSGSVLSGIGFVSDLCKHLRKSLQATFGSVGEQESDMNVRLQTSLEDLLLEIAKGISDARPLFDIMAMLLEEISSVKAVAKATIGSLVILAHMISLAAVSSQSQQVFPETLLVQLLMLMLHPDVEVRLGGHHIFSVLLIPSRYHTRQEVSNYAKRWHSGSTSTFDSVAALLEKLRREKGDARNGIKIEDEFKERDIEDELHQGRARKNSPNFNKISSFIDKTVGSPSLTETETSVLRFDDDQIAQVLTAFWMQANLPDNGPANIEAISHSFCLTLISSLKNTQCNLIVRFFHVPLSLLKVSLDLDNGSFSPAYQRSLLVLSVAMLMFTARIYHISDLVNILKSLIEHDVDPYIGISDDFQVYVKPQANVREYGSPTENQAAAILLSQLHGKMKEYGKVMVDILVENLSNITQMKADDLVNELSERFAPDDTLMFGLQSIPYFNNGQMVSCSKESPSFDGELPKNLFVDDDVASESSVADLSHFIPKMPMSPCPSMSHVVSIGQLLESALEVAGQVAGTSVSTSPLPYSAMASQCEALGTDTRKKLSNWLTHEKNQRKAVPLLPANPSHGISALRKITCEDGPAFSSEMSKESSWLALRLPPASPFDNFLRAARG
ncbi:OLC1v1002029C2 [Oldenlandia corymbosa var. corymbosa]|uniref:OLC1v1002029C2 n=1 Tax=Oldenlandia corymbosa var. corymbosa TaxID=529605 RepID=A0AAV1D6P1_OLDCO|nr:OLC1v1002029C2 [Oldenlandia corymbosa var. corymbosa]